MIKLHNTLTSLRQTGRSNRNILNAISYSLTGKNSIIITQYSGMALGSFKVACGILDALNINFIAHSTRRVIELNIAQGVCYIKFVVANSTCSQPANQPWVFTDHYVEECYDVN